jgi:hypothetical protein
MRSKNWYSVVKIPYKKINKTCFIRAFLIDFEVFLKKNEPGAKTTGN